jgi:ketosteroid isomerase-like protein
MSGNVESLLAANQAFYDAHEQRDLDAMTALWSAGDDIVCVHPGWRILRGEREVLSSWAAIFGGGGHNQFILTNVEGFVRGEVGVVTCDENLMDGSAGATIAATNVFELVDGAWSLLTHHGSPVVPMM